MQSPVMEIRPPLYQYSIFVIHSIIHVLDINTSWRIVDMNIIDDQFCFVHIMR